MKKELNADFYDNAYMSERKYLDSYHKSPYKKVWRDIINNIGVDDTIADFGCGSGQFLEMMLDNNREVVYGVDFSEVAIDRCKREMQGVNFYVDSLYNEVYDKHPYNTAVFLEVLEHVKDDVGIVNSVPVGKKVIISVPNWDTASHVRHFDSAEDVIDRYFDVLRIARVDTFDIGNQGKQIYVLYGERD